MIGLFLLALITVHHPFIVLFNLHRNYWFFFIVGPALLTELIFSIEFSQGFQVEIEYWTLKALQLTQKGSGESISVTVGTKSETIIAYLSEHII